MTSPLTLERIAQGELSLVLSVPDQRRLCDLERSNILFFQQHPAPPARRAAFQWQSWASRVAGVAALLVVGLGGLGVWAPLASETRAKGNGDVLIVYQNTREGPRRLAEYDELRAGDELQMAYTAQGPEFAAILSIDGRGVITNHLPLTGNRAVEIEDQNPQLLPYSYRLDDAPEFEAIFLITSDSSFQISAVRPFLLAMVRDGTGGLMLPDGFRATQVLVKKPKGFP